ncbi:MAG: tRNA preQ1(34) S-adenosylmethionine ribosyltransferase-isomerase QueA [Candidatus Pacebacteria bacterium]|nr:tRNA preQ1(34) S-adenosylmethionine ribosyltransferase-isomerase QueA [Candidatus Paceibacterota bacterium]
MEKSDYYFNLPSELIAQKPVNPRDSSRLLLLNKNNGEIKHDFFYNLDKYLNKGDVLVLNNSKVFPARLIGKKHPSGGQVEVFLLNLKDKKKTNLWQCLFKGKNIKVGQEIVFAEDLKAVVKEVEKNDKNRLVEFNLQGQKLMDKINKLGLVPLPPYIKRNIEDSKQEQTLKTLDKKRYQTVYAKDSKLGSVAAPTAGLHFTDNLFKKLKKKGVKIIYITLHVGLGTFAPLTEKQLKEKKLHSEFVEIRKKDIEDLKECKRNKQKIVAVGTTSTRALETVFNLKDKDLIDGYRGFTDIFIYPGYKFKIVDSMITNFHLPESSLIMLVSALAGKDKILVAYGEAIKEKYRFYSYGDAMFIF